MTKQKKTIEIKNKFINHLTIKGKKSQSEKIIYKTLKALQKTSKKPLKKLIQLALVANAPVFKLNTITKKKRKKKKQKPRIIPAFISNKTVRISFAIKFIVAASQKKNDLFLASLSKEILASSKNESNAIELKKERQKQAVLNRHLFKYYRWH